MASTANVLLHLPKGDISITLKDDGTFTVNSDPKSQIDKDEGTWEAIVLDGTRLYLTYPTEKYEYGLLRGWYLKDAKKGQSGDFDRTHGVGSDSFEITLAN